MKKSDGGRNPRKKTHPKPKARAKLVPVQIKNSAYGPLDGIRVFLTEPLYVELRTRKTRDKRRVIDLSMKERSGSQPCLSTKTPT